ncbi:hypothetical protein DM01DRAFT_1307325 [Hesseltinella vesiculosa]|uniref:EamA domain-containing protein n=1 Tax=Hesseltinella vesiculosa TaxID=101127 RepID=A0A1X2GDX8_9FUNG|nr:hypothetical protein DM01DRAFT_1307325 [Hesseltinella vesiculosa]
MPNSATYQALPINEHGIQVRTYSNSFVATAMLIICIFSFVLQTELAQYVQKTSSYHKPYLILYIGHCFYIAMGPLQFILELIRSHWRSRNQQEKPNFGQQIRDTWSFCNKHMKRSLIVLETQVRGPPLDQQPRLPSQPLPAHTIWFGFWTLLILSILFTVPTYLWYLSVNLISMSTLTVIFNTGCFWAYLFSIWMLGDSIQLSKLIAVALSILGVVVMTLDQDDLVNSTLSARDFSSSLSSVIGILVAVGSALSYGYYEVHYKKFATPPDASVLFANVMTAGIGLVTLLVLWIPIPILHITGFEPFELPDLHTFLTIAAIGLMSVVYNASMMCVIALVSPVFAAVGVMLTIPVVAVVDVLVTGVMVTWMTVLGSIFILVGFYILNKQISKEEAQQLDATTLNADPDRHPLVIA